MPVDSPRPAPVISRDEACRNARAALDVARARRDSMPVRAAAEAAAVGSSLTADEIERQIRSLRDASVEREADSRAAA